MTLHTNALATLSDWSPDPGRQSDLRQRYLDLLNAHDDALTRECFPDHLTAGVLVLSRDLDRVLLNLHRKARRWFAFGGHCEPGDTTLAGVALREGLEESGLPSLEMDPTPVHLDEHTVDFCDPRGAVQHLDVRFTALAPPAAEHAVSAESLDVRWWPVRELPEGLESEMRELIERARTRWSCAVQSTSPSLPGGSTSRAADQPRR